MLKLHRERLASATPTVLVVGKENVGKSALVGALTGRAPESTNLGGTTVAVERYAGNGLAFADAPGILRRSDAETTRRAVAALADADAVLVVAQVTHLDDDLADLIPLAAGKRGAVAVTFWDKVQPGEAALEAVERIRADLGVPVVVTDARRPDSAARAALFAAVGDPGTFTGRPPTFRAGWRIEPRAGLLEHRRFGPVLALGLLLLPAVLAVWAANTVAGLADPVVAEVVGPLAGRFKELRRPLAAVLAGKYGLVTMGPLLLVWAVPTVLLYAVLLGAYKASGLLDRINVALHPLARPFGLSGRDVARVVMGFGCNVPAVVGTRGCSGCSRGTAVAGIAFGAACSYQFPATLAVLAAAGRPGLVVPFLLYLGLTTLIYLRLTAPREARSKLNVIVLEGRTFLQWPAAAAVWREASGTVRQFFGLALPVFFAIAVVASLADRLGGLDAAAGVLAPVMGLFRLPAESALPVVLASVRKDGILLFLADGPDGPALAAPMTPAQVLTAVYLAGVLVPCLVTAWTIAREMSFGFALRLLARQATAAVLFSAVLAWGGYWLAG